MGTKKKTSLGLFFAYSQCLASTCTSLLPCTAGAGLPIHMIGKISWEPKRRRAWVSSEDLISTYDAIGLSAWLEADFNTLGGGKPGF